jgi:hypothetical protein
MGFGRMGFNGLGRYNEMGKFGRKRPLSRPSRKWDDIEINLQEVG